MRNSTPVTNERYIKINGIRGGRGIFISNLNKKLTTLIVLFLTLGITTVSAASTGSSISPQLVDGGSTDSYSLSITNEESSGDDIYKVNVNLPNDFSIDDTSTISCPTDWSVDSSSQTSFTCYTDAFGDNTVTPDNTQDGFDFSATSTTSEGYYTVDITTTDNSGNSASSSSSIEVDTTAPESDAAITDVSEVTSDGSWEVEAENISDPTSEDVSSSVDEVTLQVKTPSGEWSDVDTKNYDGSAVSFQYSLGSTNGDYSFRTVAKDRVGNEEDVSGADDTVTYDNTSPDLSIDTPTNTVYSQSDGSVDVSFTYDEQNPQEAVVSIGSPSETIKDLSAGTGESKTVNFDNLPSAGNTYNVDVEMTDQADNPGSDTVNKKVVVDDTAPTLDSATTGGSTSGDSTARNKITLSLTESLSGIDSGTVEDTDFTVSGQKVTGTSVNGETIKLTLGSKLARGATPEVTVAEDSIEDKAGNQITETTVTASDGLSPQNPLGISFTQSSVNKDNDENIDVDVNFDSAPESGEVTLRVDDSDGSDDDAKTFTKSASQTTTFSAKDLSTLDDGTLTATAKIVDDSDNTNSEGFTASQEIQKDTTNPVLQNAVNQTDEEFTFEVHDEGNGLDESTVESGDFTITDTDHSASSFSVGTCNERDSTCTVTVTLSDPIDHDTLEVGFTDGGQLSDIEGNIQSSDTVQVSGMDGVAPKLVTDSATRVDNTTIDVTLSDDGVGLDESTVEQGDFSVSAGSISRIQTNFGDGANSGTVTINLDSPVDSTSVDVSLQSGADGVSDTNSNSQDSGTATASDMDGVAPSISDPTITSQDAPLSDGDQVTVYATVNDDGAGVDTVEANMSRFGAGTDVALNSEIDAEQDFDGDSDKNSDVYGAEVTLDETQATGGSQFATVEATDLANNQNTNMKDTNSLEVDLTPPSITSISPTSFTESDENSAVEVTVEFGEAMDTTVAPNVNVNGDGSVSNIGWSNEDLTFDYDVPTDVESTPTVNINGVQDEAGNSADFTRDLTVDTVEPTVDSISLERTPISDSETSDPQTLTVDFSEAMTEDESDVTVTPDVDGDISKSVTVSSKEFVNSDTIEAELDFPDTGQDTHFTVKVEGATDAEGNSLESAGTQDFQMDTKNPVSPASADASVINLDNVNDYTVGVNFDSVPESGSLYVKLEGPGGGSTAVGTTKDPSSETLEIDLGPSDLEDGKVKVYAKYNDDEGNWAPDNSDNSYEQLTTVTKDTVRPELDSATAVDRTTVMAYFDEELNSDTVDPADFKVDGNTLADYQMVSDSSGDGTATAEYAVTENGEPAVHAHGSANGDYATAGLSFPVDTSFDGSNEIKVSFTEGDNHMVNQDQEKLSPDWIGYKVEDDSSGSVYYIFDYGVDETSGTTVSWDGTDTFGDGSNEIVYDSKWGVASESASQLKDSSTIKKVFVKTGSQGDSAEFDLYYTGVEFNGDEQLASFVENAGMTDSSQYNATLHLGSELDTDATPEIKVDGEVKDVEGNTQSGVSVTANDEIAPEVASVTTFSDDDEADADGVEVKFTEDLEKSTLDESAVSVGSSVDFTPSVSGDVLTLDFNEGEFGTADTPTVDVDAGAVGDSSSGTENLAAEIQATDGVSPVVEAAEINQDQSSKSGTVVNLEFSESVSITDSATATFEAAPGELRFDAQTGETLQANYYEEGSKAVLETGDSPEVSSFSELADSARNVAVNSLGTDIKTFTRTLEEGSNMVSFPLIQGQKPVSEVIGSGTEGGSLSSDNVDTVWTYENGEWKELATGESSDYFRGGLGYIFNLNTQDTLSVNVDHEYQQKDKSVPESLELSSTWNLVGSYQEYDQTTTDALSSLDSSYEAYDENLNCVDKMQTGEGYWLTRSDNNGYTTGCASE